MVTASLFLTSSTARATLCRSCLLLSLAAGRHQTRSITLRVLEKDRLAKLEWAKKARQIQAGEARHLWDILKERGFVKDIAGLDEEIYDLMLLKRIGAYVGIDPTASSLHLGHLLPLMALFWMYLHGYKAISVIGGATAKVGDPTDRLKSRDPISKADMSMNITKMHYQLKRIWLNVEAQGRRFGYEKDWAWRRALLNNSQWYNSVSFVDVVSRLFQGMRLGPMLSRDNVKQKMNNGDGMSLAEFVYPLMQAWDWWHMYSGKLDINMQIGGSDQYGNIVTGTHCIRHLRATEPDPQKKIPRSLLHQPVGFTVPLLTDASGTKFGKTAGNAMWLDPFMTSPYDLYGYLMRRPDNDVERLLKLFTFFPLKEIQSIMEQHNQDPSKRHAHHSLAFEVVALVHGYEEAITIKAQHMVMFAKGYPTALDAARGQVEETTSYPSGNQPATYTRAVKFRVDIQLPESLIMSKSISRILYAAGLTDSVSEAHRLVAHQGAYVGGAPGQPAALNKGMPYGELMFTPVKTWFPQDTKNFLIEGKILILRRGKHFVRVVEMVSDKQWEASGQIYPGQEFAGEFRRLRAELKASLDDDAEDSVDEVESEAELEDKSEAESEAESKEKSKEKPKKKSKKKEPDIKFPRTSRAAQLLQQYELMMRKKGKRMAMKDKTEAIDEVIQKTESTLQAKREQELLEMKRALKRQQKEEHDKEIEEAAKRGVGEGEGEGKEGGREG
ncbi:hypothetical protein F5X99DRAFT_411524 [Biscogniauxia marginata]|nr:hypothetical protein F5X99DRAFT_411524 [Biscogniauxia marginata]